MKPNWFHILLSLTGGSQHGYAIMQEVLERTDGKIRLWPATLYGSLKRLVDEGFIEESDDRPDADDPRRRYYRLTTEGRQALTADIARLEDLVAAVRVKRQLLGAPSES
jgi:DNA-binding PadR family transcriptional regulator